MADNSIKIKTKSNTTNNNSKDEEIDKIKTELDGNNAVEKCSEWLNRCDLNIIDDNDEAYSVSNTDESSSVITETTENSAMDSGFVFHNNGVEMSNEIVASNTDNGARLDNLISKSNNYNNINIYKSRKVHIGDVNYIYVNQTIEQNQNFTINNTSASSLPIITRRNWLAQPPISPPEYLKEPAKYVVIIHSATEEAYTQADNTLLIRLIQTFHIESRKWTDISYNFLIGADGCIFEGRGFGVVGAYAYNYNKISLGLCFIGCYIQHIPPQIALMRAKLLIQHGVEIGAIDKDYRIIGHCQCSSTESPGRRLFEEIKTWDRWDGSVTVNNPSPLLNT